MHDHHRGNESAAGPEERGDAQPRAEISSHAEIGSRGQRRRHEDNQKRSVHRFTHPRVDSPRGSVRQDRAERSEEHTSELQSPCNLVCRLLLEKKKKTYTMLVTTTADVHKY